MNSTVDQWIAIGTLLAAVFAGASATFAGWSVRTAGKAIRAQTFLSILNTARDIDFSTCMDVVRTLPERDRRLDEFEEFDAFEHTADGNTQQRVRKAIDFLNDIAHLIRTSIHHTPTHSADLYTLRRSVPSYAFWIGGFRGSA